MVLSGELEIDVARVPGVPSLLARRLKPRIEDFIVRLLTPNLKQTNEALGRWLDAQR